MIQERVMPEGAQASDDLMISHHMARYEWVIESKQISGQEVLDLGCGEGYGTNLLRGAGYTVSGMDIDPEIVKQAAAKYGGTFISGDIRKIPTADASFDSVVCFEVIEHIELNPVAFSEMSRIIRPGGRLIISTPNAAVHFQTGHNPYHLHEFTRVEMETCLQEAGFESPSMYGQVSSHPLVTSFYESGWLKQYVRLKAVMGVSRVRFPKGVVHIAEKLVSGHTSENLSPKKIWEFVRDHPTADTMLFVAQKG